MGDMPNFEDMSEEEQMRWLESLAKRQGADETGFTTSADMEVEEVDPDTAVVDEPGYTPYYQSASASSDEQEEAPVTQETPQPQAEVPQEPEPSDAMAMAGAASDDEMSSVVGDDPMAWLESLAKRQGAHEGFTTDADLEIEEIDPDTVVVDEPGYTPYYQSSSVSAEPQEEEIEAEEVPEAPVQDPYPTPTSEAPPAPILETPEAVPVPDAPVEEEPEAPVEEGAVAAGMPGEGDLPADVDPMVWLESLAKRQGAHEGFTTSADMEVEEIDPDTAVVDEPGYTPYYSTATTGGSRQEEPAEPTEEAVPEPVAKSPIEQADEEAADGWLQSLATEQEADVDDFLTDLTETTLEEFDDDFALAASDDLEDMGVIDLDEEALDISGMSDEEIAAAQAAGTITPEQELAWLQSKISQAPDEDAFDLALADEELGEPVEGEIPDWLKDQMPTEDQLETLEDFSSAEPELDMSIDLDDSLVAELAGEGDLDIDLTEPVDDFSLEEAEPVIEATDLLAGYSPDIDEWAAALDQDVQIEDIESLPEPDWYSAAIEQADVEAPSFDTDSVPALSFDTEPITAESFFQEEEGEIPGWLQGVEPTIEEDPDLPDWLKVAPAGDEATDVSDWLSAQQAGIEEEPALPPTPEPAAVQQAEPAAAGLPLEEQLPLAQSSTMPSWYVWEEPAPARQEPVVPPPPAPTPEPTPPPVQQQEVRQEPVTPPPPAPTPTPVQEQPAPSVPVGYEDYKQRLESNPQDHDTRINLARNLSKSGNLDESLAHYETLINNSAQLDLVATDLGSMIKNLPRHPKARRMLGDVYMRQGRLQEALDTYRGALDQI